MTTSATTETTHTTNEPEYDVCVVGMGPTGLAMAHLLALRGLSVLALEREPNYYGMARAVYTDDECLRIMQNAGVANALHAEMVVDLPVQWVEADGTVLAQFHDPRQPHGWPTSNFLYQPHFEQTLENSLPEAVTVRRGRSVTSLEQDDRGVIVRHSACEGADYGRDEVELVPSSEEEVRARYVIGCDGGRSAVRSHLRISMTGKRFPQRWLVLDLRAKDGVDAFGHLPYFDFVCDPERPTVSCPQPQQRHRFEFMLQDDDATADFETVERAQELLEPYVRRDEVTIDRQLVYTFNALVAERWRDGRILLAGDAAHMTPQFIGQGMNAGLRDADNLSWKLADVIRHGAHDSLLDSYEAERRPHAQAMINLSVFNKDVVSTANPIAMAGRRFGLKAVRHLPVARAFIGEARMKPKPRLRRGAYFGLKRLPRGVEGTLMPQPRFRTQVGRPARFDDVAGTGWLAIGVGIDPCEHVAFAASLGNRRPWTWMTLFEPGTRPQGQPGAGRHAAGVITLEAIDDEWGTWLRKARAREGSIIVVRPDKYVLGIVRTNKDVTALDALLRDERKTA